MNAPEAFPTEEPAEGLYPRAPLDFPRSPASWVLLGLIFLFLIGTSLVGMRKSSLPSGSSGYTTEETAIKAAMRQRQLTQWIPGAPDTTAIPGDTLPTLRDKGKSDPEAERLYVAARQETGQKVSPEDLKSVEATGKPADRAFAQIYRSKTLTEEQARNLTKDFPPKDFSYALAKVHAFEKAGDEAPRQKLSPPWKTVALMVFAGVMAACAFVGVAIWVIYWTMRGQGNWQPLGHPADPLTPGEADRFGYRAVLLIGVYLFAQIALGMLLAGLPIGLRYFALFGTMLVLAILLHRLPVLGMPIPLSRVGARTDALGKHIFWGLLGYLATLPVLIVMALLAVPLMRIFGQSTHPATELIASNPSPLTVLGIFFGASVVAPFWEEIMFRGTMLPGMARFIGKVPAIALSSFMFASIHPQGIPLWPALGSIAAMSCALSYQTRSLVPSITLHALNNTVVLMLGLLAS